MASSAEKISYGDLEFGEKLGQSHFNTTVTLASLKRQYKGQTHVAVKSIHSLPIYRREVEILRELEHPHIIQFYDCFQEGREHFIILEYAPDGTVHEFMIQHNNQPVPDRLLIKWSTELAKALDYLHQNDVFHNDVKAKNCLLFPEHVLKISGFSLAKKLDKSHKTLSRKGSTSCGSDMSSYFRLVLEMATGDKPDEWRRFVPDVEDKLPAISESLPPQIKRLLVKGLGRHPDERIDAKAVVCMLSEGKVSTPRNDETTKFSLNRSAVIDSQGGTLSISNDTCSTSDTPACATLTIPEDAVQEGDTVDIEVSAHWGAVSTPLQEDQFQTAPVIHCQSTCAKFNKPLTLSVPHNGVNITKQNILIMSREDDEQDWHTFFDGRSPDVNTNPKVTVDEKEIKIRIYDFTWYDFFIVGGAIKMCLLAYMHPADVKHNQETIVTIYVVRPDQKQVVETEEKQNNGTSCLLNTTTFELVKADDDLQLSLSCETPKDGWDPSKKTLKVPNKDLRQGFYRTEILFKKNNPDVDRIVGVINGSTSGGQDIVESVHFGTPYINKQESGITEKFRIPHRTVSTSVQQYLDEIAIPSDTQDKFEFLTKWRNVINTHQVKQQLTVVLTNEYLHFFPKMPTADQQEIRTKFDHATRREATDVFIGILTTMPIESVPQLFAALVSHGQDDICKDMCDRLTMHNQIEKGECFPTPGVSNMSEDEVKQQLLHQKIWKEVIRKHMLQVRDLPYDGIRKVFAVQVGDFNITYARDFEAKKNTIGETKAVDWLIEQMIPTQSSWPEALMDVMKENNQALLNAVQREFWNTHQTKECHCVDLKKFLQIKSSTAPGRSVCQTNGCNMDVFADCYRCKRHLCQEHFNLESPCQDHSCQKEEITHLQRPMLLNQTSVDSSSNNSAKNRSKFVPRSPTGPNVSNLVQKIESRSTPGSTRPVSPQKLIDTGARRRCKDMNESQRESGYIGIVILVVCFSLLVGPFFTKML